MGERGPYKLVSRTTDDDTLKELARSCACIIWYSLYRAEDLNNG
jgi:hypothetical protein